MPHSLLPFDLFTFFTYAFTSSVPALFMLLHLSSTPSSITSPLHTPMTCTHDLLTKVLSVQFPTPDTSLQLRRDVIFCQAATGALCTLAEQLLAALRSRFNNAGEYQEDSKETSHKWLEQISAIGALLCFQSTLAPHVVRTDLIFPFVNQVKLIRFLIYNIGLVFF